MNNSESKTPEVGDVWQWIETYLIYRITTSFNGRFVHCIYKAGDGAFLTDYYREDYFIKHCTYLGKSVVDVSKLFKVKRAVNKERMKDEYLLADDWEIVE